MVNDERCELIAEIKLQCENINNRIEELLTQYSIEDLKTIKETMKYDNERFQYRLNNQEITILNTKDNSLKMIVTQENGETTQVYDGDKRSSMVISDDDGVMVIQTNKEVGKTAMRFNSDEEEMYFDENGASILISDDDSSLDLEIDGNKIKSNFNVDDNVSLSLNGKIKNGKITGKLKGIDLEYKEEFKKLGENDFEDKAKYKYAKNAGVVNAEFKEGEIKYFEARDFMDGCSPDGDHSHYVAKKDKNGNMYMRLEEGEDVLEGVNILPEEIKEPISDYIVSDLTQEENNKDLSPKLNSQSESDSAVNESVKNENSVKPVIFKPSILHTLQQLRYEKEGFRKNIEQQSFSKCEYYNVTDTDTGESKKFTIIRGEDGEEYYHGAVIYQDGDGNVIADKCKVYDHGKELNLDGKNVVYNAGIDNCSMFCEVDGKTVGPKISVSEIADKTIAWVGVYDCNGKLMKPRTSCEFTYTEDKISFTEYETSLLRANLKEDLRSANKEFSFSAKNIEREEMVNNIVDEKNSNKSQKDSTNGVYKIVAGKNISR